MFGADASFVQWAVSQPGKQWEALKKMVGKSEVGPVTTRPSPAKKEY